MPIVVSGSPKYKVNIFTNFKLGTTKYKCQKSNCQYNGKCTVHQMKGCIENVKLGLISNASDLTLNVADEPN